MTLSARAIAVSGIGFSALLVSISGLLPDARASDMGGAGRTVERDSNYERVTPIRRDLTALSATEIAARDLAEQVSAAIRAKLVAESRAEEFTEAAIQRAARSAIEQLPPLAAPDSTIGTGETISADDESSQQFNNRRRIAILIALLLLL